MALMYDSINVDAIPATATDLLGYTDGQYANIAALRARFPNARIHTISCAGQVVAEWLDVESGCLWPNSSAADLFRVWRLEGCLGYYTSLNNEQALREAHNAANPGVTAEWFDANYTFAEHVDPGNVATQYADPGPYDISDTTPQFEADPLPPTPPPPVKEEDVRPFVCYLLDGAGKDDQFYVIPGVGKYGIADPTTSASLCSVCGQTGPVGVSTAFLNSLPPAV